MAKTRKKARRAARSRRRATKAAAGVPGTPLPAPGTSTADLASLAGPLNVIATSLAVVAMRPALGRPAGGAGNQSAPRAPSPRGPGSDAERIAPALVSP